jgi:hypothetical protein
MQETGVRIFLDNSHEPAALDVVYPRHGSVIHEHGLNYIDVVSGPESAYIWWGVAGRATTVKIKFTEWFMAAMDFPAGRNTVRVARSSQESAHAQAIHFDVVAQHGRVAVYTPMPSERECYTPQVPVVDLQPRTRRSSAHSSAHVGAHVKHARRRARERCHAHAYSAGASRDLRPGYAAITM